MTAERPTRVVVGGGIAGLAAAYFLAGDRTHDVLLLEGSPDVGGKLRRHEVGGVTVDVGAEAMLNRRPEAIGLARELGLDLVHPATISSALWTRGALRPMPRSVMGVPIDLDQLTASGVLSEAGLARVRQEPDLPATVLDGDVSVESLVAGRLGQEVVDRLVEPLLGGVYAGHAASLSARAALPQVVAMLQRDPSLLRAAAALPPAPDSPVFAGLVGGMGRLAQALVDSGRFRVETAATVRELRRTADGFELVVGSTRDPRVLRASDVVLATPALPTSRLLADLAPAAARELAGIEYASMAIVTLAFRSADLPELPGSGFLVPPVDGRRIKAATFSFAKWDWVREAGRGAGPDGGDLLLLRASLGRHREEAALQVSDEDLVTQALADLSAATGLVAVPVDAHVQRWGGGLPQYAVGHLDRVDRIRAAVSSASSTHVRGRIAVCGAAYDGIGIPACIAAARRAADLVVAAQWAP